MQDIETFYPTSPQEWRDWLVENHQSKQSIWLIYYKMKANKSRLSWSEAVDQALCFGWIDSTAKTLDDDRYMQFFTKRKPNSVWSKINKDKVSVLIEQGLMQKAGYESIEIAKKNGSWTILDSVEALEIPEDLEAEFSTKPDAKDFFLSLNKSTKKAILYWLVSAKRPETRQKRILEIIESASQKQKPKQFP